MTRACGQRLRWRRGKASRVKDRCVAPRARVCSLNFPSSEQLGVVLSLEFVYLPTYLTGRPAHLSVILG